jgi:hypothetical protein
VRVRGATCARQRCKRPPKVAGLCKTHATEEADRRFSRAIRAEGSCAARFFDSVACAGGLQCAHGFSRRYRSTRWDERNAFPLCQAHHTYYTHRPIEWDLWLRERWGENLYLILQAKALATTPPDLEDVLAEFADFAQEREAS